MVNTGLANSRIQTVSSEVQHGHLAAGAADDFVGAPACSRAKVDDCVAAFDSSVLNKISYKHTAWGVFAVLAVFPDTLVLPLLLIHLHTRNRNDIRVPYGPAPWDALSNPPGYCIRNNGAAFVCHSKRQGVSIKRIRGASHHAVGGQSQT